MTDPKVLADALVEAGILRWFETVDGYDGSLVIINVRRETMATEAALKDWRVAGKVLESIYDGPLVIQTFMNDVIRLTVKGADLPRAIIEAWYESR